jgi:hypothetical protein
LNRTITPTATPAPWDPDALYAKALRYVQRMGELDKDDWEYALWSSFSLEFLARAALANVTPALLAETDKSWSSLYAALGFTPTEEKFAPKSIAISEVFKRLSAILPTFTKEYESFCIQHTGRRNAELHSGEAAFEGIKGSSWQPRLYQTCQVLLASMGMTLQDFVGEDESKVASQLMVAAADESAKAVKGDVEAHKRVWLAKEQTVRETLVAQAALWASRQAGHRVECPACGSQALVVGDPVGAPLKTLDGDVIFETQEHLPNQFECIACALKIAGLSRLAVMGLADRYKKTQVYDAAEYYAPDDRYAGYEEDNNEY